MERSNLRSNDSDAKEHRQTHTKKKRRRDSSSGGEGRVKKNTSTHSKKSKLSSHSHQKRKYRHSDSDNSLDSELSFSSSPERKRKHKKCKKDTFSKKSSKKKRKHGHETVKRKMNKPKKNLHEEVESLASKVEVVPPTAGGEPATRNVATLLAAQTTVKGPMTKDEYERQQSIVRRVYDPDTGRHRLVKGDGEIIEEIVSRERHRAINKQATLGDGSSFQALTRRLL